MIELFNMQNKQQTEIYADYGLQLVTNFSITNGS